MDELLLTLGRDAALLALTLAAPLALAVAAAALLTSVFQATTQLQEPTLSLVPRLLVAAITLVVAGPWMGRSLMHFAVRVFEALPAVAR